MNAKKKNSICSNLRNTLIQFEGKDGVRADRLSKAGKKLEIARNKFQNPVTGFSGLEANVHTKVIHSFTSAENYRKKT